MTRSTDANSLAVLLARLSLDGRIASGEGGTFHSIWFAFHSAAGEANGHVPIGVPFRSPYLFQRLVHHLAPVFIFHYQHRRAQLRRPAGVTAVVTSLVRAFARPSSRGR